MSEREKMLAGLYYKADDPELVQLRAHARRLTSALNNMPVTELAARSELIQSLLGITGSNVYIEPVFHCDYGHNIHVGDNFFANFDCVILDVAAVHIGNNCFMAPQVGLYTATHPLDPTARAAGLEYAKPIRIGNDCWIGGHATINPGVTLGDNVVVAAGAVVTHSYGNNVVLAGVPARVIKTITNTNEQPPGVE